MNGFKIIATVVSGLLLLSACSTGSGAPEDTASMESADSQNSASESEAGAYHKITAEEAKQMMDAGGVTVVDVRRAREYTQKHIPGAILVPNETIQTEAAEKLPDKEAVLLVHCRTGARSKQASDKLVAMGYQNIYDFGGIVDWPYETESGAAE